MIDTRARMPLHSNLRNGRLGNKLSSPLSNPVRRYLCVLIVCMPLSVGAKEVCPDIKAKQAGDEKALSYFKTATVFHPAKVFKRHNPDGEKEVASYVEVIDGRRYSIFTLVYPDCRTRFIKRTRQND